MPTNPISEKIVSLCELHWNAHKSNCSGFVKAVAKDLNVLLTGQANDIIDHISSTPWQNVSSGAQAKIRAEEGMFVIGGLKAQPNGHVVIVVPGSLAHGKYPTAYWGRLGGEGKKNTPINWSWNRQDRDNVIYKCLRLGTDIAI